MHLYKSVMLSLVFMLLFTGSCYSKKQPPHVTANNDGFAVIELFTSEGCSSCPAAEAVLAELNNEHKKNVYVMEFHVDYWNYIGWKDVFSSSEYTRRQQQYASRFNLGSTYTPQAVVNGEKELVGSDREKLHGIINTDLQKIAAATVQVTAKATGNKVAVSYSLTNAKGQLLNIALVQKEAATNVKRGENSGRKLQHINIVRSLKTINTQDAGIVSIDLPPGLTAADCTIIAYTQQKNTLGITGAAQAMIN